MRSRIRSSSGWRSGSSASGSGVERRAAGLRVAVDDRELDLALVGVEVEEELVHLVDDRLDPRVRPVDLVDDEDHRQPRLERLAQHEARLRQRPLARVDEQEHAVDHRQPALDLAAEVGVARRVDDVDLRPAVADGRVLGEDRDALLALEVDRVEHALGDVLVRAEGAGLPEQRVDERRLAVVDVRDDGDVADIRADGHRLRVATATRAPVGALVRHCCRSRLSSGSARGRCDPRCNRRASPPSRSPARAARRTEPTSACTCCRTPSRPRAPR